MPNGAEPENGKPLSNQLTERLTAERTVALQECLAAKPEVALICVNPGCEYTTENCGTQTVKSCLVLAGLI